MAWKNKLVYVITIFLKDTDDTGEHIDWTTSTEECYADTMEEALIIKQKFLDGNDFFYGDLIDSCIISDSKEMREFWE